MAPNMGKNETQRIGIIDIFDNRAKNGLSHMISREGFLPFRAQEVYAEAAVQILCHGCLALCSKMNPETGIADADIASKDKRKCKVK